MIKLSINILTWNNKSTIAKLIKALSKDVHLLEREYIFVDNGSDDGTVDIIENWIAHHKTERIKFIKNEENKGISIGKNQGIDESVGEYILMLDGDVVPVNNTILLMIKWLDENRDKHALGMFPNKFCIDETHAEKTCVQLIDFRTYKCCCLYYGLFRKSMFDDGLRMCEEGEYGKPGYGWEDHDFFQRMKERGIEQWVAHINTPIGKYYHHINSSIRSMGREKYMATSRLRDKQFKETWEANAVR